MVRLLKKTVAGRVNIAIIRVRIIYSNSSRLSVHETFAKREPSPKSLFPVFRILYQQI